MEEILASTYGEDSLAEPEEEYDNEYICRVCGYEYDIPVRLEVLDEPHKSPDTPNRTVGTHDICICCNAEFGFDDNYMAAVRRSRKEWEETGYKFDDGDPEYKPQNWDPCEQMKKIPLPWSHIKPPPGEEEPGNEYICRVCGKEWDWLLWYTLPKHPDTQIPPRERCYCCGTESGITDTSIGAVRRRRQEWKELRYKWSFTGWKPESWDAEEQMRNIPAKWW